MRVLLAAAALAALMPAAAQAQETRTEERRVVVFAGPGGPVEVGEAGLTREAFMAGRDEMFARLDADSNGVVSREEMQAHAEAMMGEHRAEFTGEDGERIVIRRRGPGGEGLPMTWHGEGGPGERDVVIIRRGADGETIDLEGGPGDWTSEDGRRRIIVREVGPDGGPLVVGDHGEGGERHVMVFRHSAEGGLDSDGDGRWTFEEMVAPMREHFNQLDANGDGFVDEAERQH